MLGAGPHQVLDLRPKCGISEALGGVGEYLAGVVGCVGRFAGVILAPAADSGRATIQAPKAVEERHHGHGPSANLGIADNNASLDNIAHLDLALDAGKHGLDIEFFVRELGADYFHIRHLLQLGQHGLSTIIIVQRAITVRQESPAIAIQHANQPAFRFLIKKFINRHREQVRHRRVIHDAGGLGALLHGAV